MHRPTGIFWASLISFSLEAAELAKLLAFVVSHRQTLEGIFWDVQVQTYDTAQYRIYTDIMYL
jgi:hypothetical protein